ncbi:MAG: hypothetical protein MUF54_05880, partial [Polyangiaceae bacterium]|nr:hypothetical protein [Polyangiaceae bacterium]
MRTSSLQSATHLRCRVVDGLAHVLPWGIPAAVQLGMGALADAYKRVELVADAHAAVLSLTSGISDRPYPHEILRASTVCALGLGPEARILIADSDVQAFAQGRPVSERSQTQGERGAFFVAQELFLRPQERRSWTIVADTGRSQAQVQAFLSWLRAPEQAEADVRAQVAETQVTLERILAQSDGFQATGRTAACVAHTAHTTFNLLRGGVPYDVRSVWGRDFFDFVEKRNKALLPAAKRLFQQDQRWLDRAELVSCAKRSGNPQLERLALEYMPLVLGRRHGDPSRPWNRF